MTNGTFSALNVEPFVFTSNESEYDEVKGYVEDGVLIIECENTSSNASVSWIIFGKRNDDTIQNSKLTDGSGNYITEIPLLSFYGIYHCLYIYFFCILIYFVVKRYEKI